MTIDLFADVIDDDAVDNLTPEQLDAVLAILEKVEPC